MAKISVKKSAAKAAPTFAPPADTADVRADDLGISTEDFDLDSLGVEDISFDDLGIAEVDDTAITVEDVEAAMQSIAAPTSVPSVPAGVASVGEAALAALSAEVAKLTKGLKDMDKSQQLLEAIHDLKDSVVTFANSVTNALERHSDFVAERLDALTNNAPVSAAPAAAPGADRIDTFLKAQFEGLASGKLYPADKVASVFAQRLGDVTPEQVLDRMTVVYAAAFTASGKPGLFQK